MRKSTMLLLCLLNIILLRAQVKNEFNFTFNHMALSVKDLDVSIDFYKKVFQLAEIRNRSAIEGIRWLSAGEDKELHLISIMKEPVKINKAVHLAFTTQTFDAFALHLQNLKIDYSDWPGKPNTINARADGVKQIYFQDPDGYWIEVNNGYAAVLSVEDIKNQVWQLEIDYWKYVKERDLKAYITLWDEKFIGYPSNNIITGKDHITEWINNMYKDGNRTLQYELKRRVESVFDNVVIVLYDVDYTVTNDKKEIVINSKTKITHTWKKTDKGWVIIGGMGANK